MTDRMPIFDLTDHFDTTIPIGDAELPIHVKRMSRAELEDFDKKWTTLVVTPRGSATLAPGAGADDRAAYLESEKARLRAWNDEVKADRLKFFEDAIGEYITVDEGLLVDRGRPVTDGRGLIAMFYSRPDVLSDLQAAIYVENHLGSVLKKKSNSPPASAPGSALSIASHGGDAPASTAGSAASSGTAGSGDAPEATTGPSSGETPKIH